VNDTTLRLVVTAPSNTTLRIFAPARQAIAEAATHCIWEPAAGRGAIVSCTARPRARASGKWPQSAG
jgi:hypothetical protein